jgi:hypothetical protein
MRKVWNNVSPKKIGKNHVFVSKLGFIYASFELYEVFKNAFSHKMRPRHNQFVLYSKGLIYLFIYSTKINKHFSRYFF